MMVVMMAVDPTRHPHDDTAVMMVMMPVAAVMMVMTHADIELRQLHVGFILGRSRGIGGLGRLQCGTPLASCVAGVAACAPPTVASPATAPTIPRIVFSMMPLPRG
jgi:hypothetical protein